MLMEMPAEELAGAAAEPEKEGRAPECQGAEVSAGEVKSARREIGRPACRSHLGADQATPGNCDCRRIGAQGEGAFAHPAAVYPRRWGAGIGERRAASRGLGRCRPINVRPKFVTRNFAIRRPFDL